MSILLPRIIPQQRGTEVRAADWTVRSVMLVVLHCSESV